MSSALVSLWIQMVTLAVACVMVVRSLRLGRAARTRPLGQREAAHKQALAVASASIGVAVAGNVLALTVRMMW